MASFLGGTFLGLVTVGGYSYRTIQILEGHPLRTLLASLTVSCTYWFSITFIVNDDLSGYFGFSLGAALVTTHLSWQKKRKLERQEGES